MGGRGSNIKTSHGMRQAAALTPGQALVAKLRADPTALLRMTDSEALTAFQEIENRPIGQGENDKNYGCLHEHFLLWCVWKGRKARLRLRFLSVKRT